MATIQQDTTQCYAVCLLTGSNPRVLFTCKVYAAASVQQRGSSNGSTGRTQTTIIQGTDGHHLSRWPQQLPVETVPVARYCALKPRKASMARRPFFTSFTLYSSRLFSLPLQMQTHPGQCEIENQLCTAYKYTGARMLESQELKQDLRIQAMCHPRASTMPAKQSLYQHTHRLYVTSCLTSQVPSSDTRVVS